MGDLKFDLPGTKWMVDAQNDNPFNVVPVKVFETHAFMFLYGIKETGADWTFSGSANGLPNY